MRHSQNGLSFVAIIIVGLVFSFFLLAGMFGVRYVTERWSPSTKNIERQLRKGKYREALALAEKVRREATFDHPDYYIQEAKIWLAMATERYDEEQWAQYGTNDRDWFPGPEAKKAYVSLKKALSLDSSSVEARYYLGMLAMKKGWFHRAEELFNEVVARDSRHIDARINLSVIFRRTGRLQSAEQELRAAFRIDPGNADITKNIAYLYRFHLEQPESAMVWFNRYLNRVGDGDPDRYYAKRQLLDLMQRYPEFHLAEKQAWRREFPRPHR